MFGIQRRGGGLHHVVDRQRRFAVLRIQPAERLAGALVDRRDAQHRDLAGAIEPHPQHRMLVEHLAHRGMHGLDGAAVRHVQRDGAHLDADVEQPGRVRCQRQVTGFIARTVLDHRDPGQRRDRARLENRTGREGHATGAAARHDLDGDDTVAAEREEIVVQPDPVEAEHLADHLGDGQFRLGLRRTIGRGRQGGFGQRAPIQLADRRQRDLVEFDDGGRHHVFRQNRAQFLGERGDVEGGALRGQHIGHEHRGAGTGFAADSDREFDTRLPGQRGVDLAEFDPETAHLHLEVVAAHVLHLGRSAAPPPAHHVAGAVEPLTRRTVRVGHEARRREAGPRVVAAGQLDAAQIEFARNAFGHRAQSAVEHQRTHAADRATDGDRFARAQGIADVGHDRGLGRPVAVVEAPLPVARPLGHQIGGHRFTARDDRPHAGQGVRVQRSEHRRGEEGVRDLLLLDQARQFGAAEGERRRDHQCARRTQREQQLEHRGVERRRGESQCAGGLVELIALYLLGTEIGQARVRDHHALGQAGGAGGVDHVRGVAAADRAVPLTEADRPVRAGRDVIGEVPVVEYQPRPSARHRGQRAELRGQRHAEIRLRVGDHVRDALGRIGRIDRHQRGAGLGHRPQREHRFDRTPDSHRDQHVRPGAAIDQ